MSIAGPNGPAGFAAAGVAAGLKEDGRLDLALVATEDRRPVPAAAVFTTNRAAAAPVRVSAAHLKATGGRAVAVVVNSGNANAATGPSGRADSERTCDLLAASLGTASSEVLVCSTGLIGIPLPMGRIEAGLPRLADALSTEGAGAEDAARAIMTTDTRPKQVSVAAEGFRVGGMAKGAAMLAPNMATMLAVLTTDAEVDGTDLREALRASVDESFNQITVDGCTSTNDTVVVLASGRAARVGKRVLTRALTDACEDLAAQMIADAEGATKVITVTVTGARSVEDAELAARRVADSLLVKCSLNGGDPYWGRVVSELGSAGAAFNAELVSVSYGGVVVCDKGVAVAHDAAAVAEHLRQRDIELSADLGLGSGQASVLTCDLGHGYIDENVGTS